MSDDAAAVPSPAFTEAKIHMYTAKLILDVKVTEDESQILFIFGGGDEHRVYMARLLQLITAIALRNSALSA
jgi:hypothetical protein